MKIKLDSKVHEVPDEVGEFLQAQQKRLDGLDVIVKDDANLRIQNATLQARCDELKEAFASRLDSAPSKEAIQARVKLERQAARVLGDTVKLDEMDDVSVKKAAIAKKRPNVNLDGKDEAYVNARFDAIIEDLGAEALGNARKGVLPVPSLTHTDELDERVRKAREELGNAWQKPLTFTVQK